MSNKPKLTDENVKDILSAMEENMEASNDLKVLAELPSNNGDVEVPEYKGEVEPGYEEKVTVRIDPKTGISSPTNDEDCSLEEGFDQSFEDLIAKVQNGDVDNKPVDINTEDIKRVVENNDEFFKDFEMTAEETMQLLSVVKRVQNGEKFSVFKALPLEVQKRLEKYMAINGLSGHDAKTNGFRNDLAELIISEFISDISLQKYTMDFQNEMNALQNKVNEELSSMYMDYNENREKYIQSIIENSDDEEKKKAVGEILDSIQDGFNLERIKEAARNHKIKIKKFDIEKPKRSFDSFLSKYEKSTYNIYSIYTVLEVMKRHFKNDVPETEIAKFLVAICKVTQNYKCDNPTEHAFMYYSMYNALLLDIYKGEDYQKFAPLYKKNVLEVIELLNN